MHRYIGIDVHTESCTFAIMGPTGKRLREARVETNAKVLTEFVRSIAGQKHVCIEEGTLAEWMYELLEPLVDELVVTIPERARGSKSDSSDAWRRADELRRGSISRPVFKAPDRFTALRAAAKTYTATQRDMVRTKPDSKTCSGRGASTTCARPSTTPSSERVGWHACQQHIAAVRSC